MRCLSNFFLVLMSIVLPVQTFRIEVNRFRLMVNKSDAVRDEPTTHGEGSREEKGEEGAGELQGQQPADQATSAGQEQAEWESAPEYTISSSHSNVCTQGYEPIANLTSCRDAALALGLIFKSSGSWPENAHGCYKTVADSPRYNSFVWYNADAGSENSRQGVICQKSTAYGGADWQGEESPEADASESDLRQQREPNIRDRRRRLLSPGRETRAAGAVPESESDAPAETKDVHWGTSWPEQVYKFRAEQEGVPDNATDVNAQMRHYQISPNAQCVVDRISKERACGYGKAERRGIPWFLDASKHGSLSAKAEGCFRVWCIVERSGDCAKCEDVKNELDKAHYKTTFGYSRHRKNFIALTGCSQEGFEGNCGGENVSEKACAALAKSDCDSKPNCSAFAVRMTSKKSFGSTFRTWGGEDCVVLRYANYESNHSGVDWNLYQKETFVLGDTVILRTSSKGVCCEVHIGEIKKVDARKRSEQNKSTPFWVHFRTRPSGWFSSGELSKDPEAVQEAKKDAIERAKNLKIEAKKAKAEALARATAEKAAKAARIASEAAQRAAKAATEKDAAGKAAAAAETATRTEAEGEKALAAEVLIAIKAIDAELRKTWGKPEANRKENMRRLGRLWHPDKSVGKSHASVFVATEVMKHVNGCRDRYLQPRAAGIRGKCSR